MSFEPDRADMRAHRLRAADRRDVRFSTTFALQDGEDLPIAMEDLSPFGGRGRVAQCLRPGTFGRLLLLNGEAVPAIVVWRHGDRHGFRFLRTLSSAKLLQGVVEHDQDEGLKPRPKGWLEWLRRLAS